MIPLMAMYVRTLLTTKQWTGCMLAVGFIVHGVSESPVRTSNSTFKKLRVWRSFGSSSQLPLATHHSRERAYVPALGGPSRHHDTNDTPPQFLRTGSSDPTRGHGHIMINATGS